MTILNFLQLRLYEAMVLYGLLLIYALIIAPESGRDFGERVFLFPVLSLFLIYGLMLYFFVSGAWLLFFSKFVFGDNFALRNATAPLVQFGGLALINISRLKSAVSDPTFLTIGVGVLILSVFNYWVIKFTH